MQENLGGHFQPREVEVTLSWSPWDFLCIATCSFRTLWPIHLVRGRKNKCFMKIHCWEGLKIDSSVRSCRFQYECLFIGIYQRGRSCIAYSEKPFLEHISIFFKYQVQQSRGEKCIKFWVLVLTEVYFIADPWNRLKKMLVFFFSHYDERFTRQM